MEQLQYDDLENYTQQGDPFPFDSMGPTDFSDFPPLVNLDGMYSPISAPPQSPSAVSDFALAFLNSIDVQEGLLSAPEDLMLMDPTSALSVEELQIVKEEPLSSPPSMHALSSSPAYPLSSPLSSSSAPVPPPAMALSLPTLDSKSGLSLRILGVPEKSRVETQIKLCLQLVNRKGVNITHWKSIHFPEHLLVKGQRTKKDQKIKSESSDGIIVEAQVVCASDHSKQVLRCFGCIQRERKSMERKKKNGTEEESRFSIEEEQRKILQFYCGTSVDFSCGEAIIPTRVTCYCRHHEEKQGFHIYLCLRDAKTNQVIASALSPEVMITDDHKSKPKGAKRPRTMINLKSEVSFELTHSPSAALIQKIIPSEGPTIGGVEVTVLGKNFEPGNQVLFGDAEAISTSFWGKQSLLCVVPPSISACTVPVTVKGVDNDEQDPVLFTYKDDSDRLMMELALQVVGMKLTGKVDDAKKIAQKIVTSNQGAFTSSLGMSSFGNQSHKSNEERTVFCLTHILSMNTGHKVNVSLQNSRGHTLLILAAVQGSHELCKMLLQYGINVNIQDKVGFTALHYAAMLGYQGIARLLLQQSNQNLRSLQGQTARDLAKKWNHAHIVDILNPPSILKPAPRITVSAQMPTSYTPTFAVRRSGEFMKAESFTHVDSDDCEVDLEKGSISPNMQRPASLSLMLTLQYYYLNYRSLVVVVGLLLFGAGILSGGMPWQQISTRTQDISSLNRLHQDETAVGNIKQDAKDAITTTSPLKDSTEETIHPMQTPHYWVAILSYLILSSFIVAALVYKYRFVWKIKTVLSIVCILFLLFAMSQVAIFDNF